jgi:hypothetical protein
MVYHDRKIRNKERCVYRGKRQRYAVWRGEDNQKWERCFEELVRRLCEYNDLVVEEQMVQDERIPWEHTFDKLDEEGYRLGPYKGK